MSDCGRYAKKSPQKNYSCMRKGVGVGSHIKLPQGYTPRDESENKIYCGFARRDKNSSPYSCFKKGFALGKKIQYGNKKYKMKEDFTAADDLQEWVDKPYGQPKSIFSTYTLFIAIFVGFITFGLFIALEIYWLWAVIIGIASSSLFLYFCNCKQNEY